MTVMMLNSTASLMQLSDSEMPWCLEHKSVPWDYCHYDF